MTDRSPEARLRQLIERWREIGGRPNRPTGFLICADELEALLAEALEKERLGYPPEK